MRLGALICMPRPPRQDFAGAVQHVYARGNAKQAIYLDDTDRRIYLSTLARVVARHEWRVLAYCLMPNHVHLLVETPRPNLGVGMQLLHGRYAQTFNARHSQPGHLFQGRFGSALVKEDGQLWMTAAYIAANPVKARLCTRPEDWRWSSHAATLGGARPPWLDVPRLLEHLAGLGADPRRTYATLVDERIAAV